MNQIKWAGYNWLTQQPWGVIHPAKPVQWYDQTAIQIREESLILKTQYHPQVIKTDQGRFYPKVGVGLVYSVNSFSHGYFEIEAKLPSGEFLWPAFWLVASDVWPPEIDVIEGYSTDKNYLNNSWKFLLGKFWRAASNIHLSENPDKSVNSLGAQNHWLGFANPSKRFNKYGLLWTKSEVSIFYNGRKVRKHSDPKTLETFKGKKLHVIINNAIDAGYKESAQPSEFIIKSFTYKP